MNKQTLMSLLQGRPSQFFDAVRERLNDKASLQYDSVARNVADSVFNEVVELEEGPAKALNKHRKDDRATYRLRKEELELSEDETAVLQKYHRLKNKPEKSEADKAELAKLKAVVAGIVRRSVRNEEVELAEEKEVWRVYLVEPIGNGKNSYREFGQDYHSKEEAQRAKETFSKSFPKAKYTMRKVKVKS